MKPIKSISAISLCLVGLLTLCALKATSKGHSRQNYHKIHLTDADAAPYVPRKKGTLTFAKDIAPIMLDRCAGCHRAGEVAPFSLLTYSDMRKHAQQVALVTQQKLMPPWKADSHGEFVGENRLTADQIGMIRQWTDEGMKEGKASEMPPTPKFASGWKMGAPDAELTTEKVYTLGPEGRDEFHTFLIHTDFSEDRYISAVEVRPGNRAVVHHTILSVDTSGKLRKRATEAGVTDFATTNGSGVPDTVLDIWTPGKMSERLPDGIGMPLPRGADLVLEIHYHRTGKPEPDQTRIGLYFCKGPVNQRLRVHGLLATRLNIPPGDAHYETGAQLTVPADTTLHSIFPHMHLIGKSMTVTLTLPDGKEQTLVDVPNWDFNWQNTYLYKNPVKLPKGSKIKMVASFDNSAANPRNPNNPPKQMGWGEQTTNEMCLVFFGFTVDNEKLALK